MYVSVAITSHVQNEGLALGKDMQCTCIRVSVAIDYSLKLGSFLPKGTDLTTHDKISCKHRKCNTCFEIYMYI